MSFDDSGLCKSVLESQPLLVNTGSIIICFQGMNIGYGCWDHYAYFILI
jgi:hypothetical protein